MLLSHLVLAACWVLYCVLHSVLASTSVKARVQQRTGSAFRYYRLFYTVFAALSLGVLIAYQIRVPTTLLFSPNLAAKFFGYVLLPGGVGLMFICIRKYFFSLSGLKSLVQETPSSELMIGGIHRFMRHPLYTGTFAAIWGFWLIHPTCSVLVADVIITVYTLWAIRLEEAKLVAEFGEDYREYQRQVPKLIPRRLLAGRM